MFLQPLDLTTALRPNLLPEETLLFVQDAVGLYDRKYKIPIYQHGHAYLTTHRACYVDNAEPRKNSVAIELKKIERYEFYAGFFKSSAKIILYPKPERSSVLSRSQSTASNPSSATNASSSNSILSPTPRRNSPFQNASHSPAPTRPSNVTWVCPICSFSNPLPSNFDASTVTAHTPLPPCLACGIKPPLAHVLKAAISGASGRQASPAPVRPSHELLLKAQTENGIESINEIKESLPASNSSTTSETTFQCPRCTFRNHPSLLSCELCGASLVTANTSEVISEIDNAQRSESPGPSLSNSNSTSQDTPECIKFSFRAGGEKVFYERLKGAMVQRKWLLQNAPPIPRPEYIKESSGPDSPSISESRGLPHRSKTVGIAGLERHGHELRKNNELVLGNAFEDLEALMTSAKELVALAESFAAKSSDTSSEASAILSESATALGMVTTKDMFGASNNNTDSLYLSELSRNLAEYLTDDAKGVLRKEGGIMSLVDLWAVFNRARGGVELVSPTDFEKAARLWEKLALPVRLRQFRSGLLVVQRYDWSDEKTIAQILAWLRQLHRAAPTPESCSWDWEAFGCGITPQQAAERFGWSIGVASEELEMAEERGAVCREESMQGVRFWENWIVERRKEG